MHVVVQKVLQIIMQWKSHVIILHFIEEIQFIEKTTYHPVEDASKRELVNHFVLHSTDHPYKRASDFPSALSLSLTILRNLTTFERHIAHC
jgi:hypothetical protein